MAHVEYFLAAVREGTFTRAAGVCGVRQPTLSLALKELESALGGALFTRRNSGVELTALGCAVRPHLAAIARSALRVGETARDFDQRNQQQTDLSVVMASGGESAGLI